MKTIDRVSAVDGRVVAPASKSYTVRALLLAALSESDTRLENCLDCDDSRYMLEALRKIGFTVEGSLHREVVVGPRLTMSAGDVELHVGNAGTAMRFLTGALTFTPGRFILRGEERMHQRPIGDLVDALRSIGGEIEYLDREGYPPLQIRGKKVRGGFEVRVDGSVSSQFVSSLMLAAGNLAQGIDLLIDSIASRPYLAITEDILRAFGATVEQTSDSVLRVMAPQLDRDSYRVEGDWSSASYWIASALATGGRVELLDLRRDSPQGDRAFLELVPRLGGEYSWSDGALTVRGSGSFSGGEFDMNDTPDVVPTLAAIAPLASSPVRITNVANLRVKESDRIAVLASELRKLGATVDEGDDSLEIQPGWKNDEVAIDPHDDHRIAMSFAIAGLARGGVTIDNDRVVGKSYPRFWRSLDELTGTQG